MKRCFCHILPLRVLLLCLILFSWLPGASAEDELVVPGQVYDGKYLCFGVNTAPQFFSLSFNDGVQIEHEINSYYSEYLIIRSSYVFSDGQEPEADGTADFGFDPENMDPENVDIARLETALMENGLFRSGVYTTRYTFSLKKTQEAYTEQESLRLIHLADALCEHVLAGLNAKDADVLDLTEPYYQIDGEDYSILVDTIQKIPDSTVVQMEYTIAVGEE